jgi:two-component system phosphate regulon sensor histidine kinase PhoR
MASTTHPAFAGVIVAAVAFLTALAAGASPTTALFAALGGGIAAGTMRRGRTVHLPSAAPVHEKVQDQPAAADLLNAVEEPLLLVRDGRVILANRSARTVLGNHIEGVDVRLAIRHPAAAELLVERQPSQLTAQTELIGLGERDRRWVMKVSLLNESTRLIHLSDRSESHASEQMRTDFVANASHELRTPLATLLGFLETLQDERAAEDPKTRSRFLGIIFDEARRMHRLVDDLISLSRIEAERFSLPRHPVALLPLIEEVRTSCAPMIEQKQSAILVEHEGSEPVVLGDRSQLLQLLQNLLVNALKYGRSGTPVTIRFEAQDADMLRMIVKDEGEGIAPEHLPRLTERFYRVDASRSRAMGGTGLGLAIVKHIVGRHRGRLDIRSKLGEGTEVRVLLPRAPAALSSKSHGSVTEGKPDLAKEGAGSDGEPDGG